MRLLKIKVIPNAKSNEVVGEYLDMLKIKVTAPPENGRANKTAIELLAREFGIPKNKIHIVKGHTAREKLIQIGD